MSQQKPPSCQPPVATNSSGLRPAPHPPTMNVRPRMNAGSCQNSSVDHADEPANNSTYSESAADLLCKARAKLKRESPSAQSRLSSDYQ
uniref:Uncharacterized protein n=1 Tax=Plectus sambesii TaxID=2011161 RepID=A0A914XL86_9BILA